MQIADFSPKNVNGKYTGYVSVKEALSKSINIPSVKILTYVGIEEAKNYARKMKINFDGNDNSYALALGGMTYGTTLKEITNAYCTFPNEGKFSEAKFVHFITDKKGNVVYKHTPAIKQVFRDDTAYLMTDMLKNSAKEGTAKKLASLSKPLASKTGTVGIKGKRENTDAWNVTYSSDYTCGVWFGNLNNAPISISGGNEPTLIAKEIFSSIKCEDFKRPSSVEEKEIDLIELEEKHILSLANSSTPERYKSSVLFSRFNEPENASTNFLVPPSANAYIEKIGNKKLLKFKAKKYLKYEFFKENELVEEISNSSEEITFELENSMNYTLKTCYLDEDLYSEKRFKVEPSYKTFEQEKKKKWFI